MRATRPPSHRAASKSPPAPLLVELERHVAEKQARDGCPILLAVEIASAVNALEGVGVEGELRIAGAGVRVGPLKARPASV